MLSTRQIRLIQVAKRRVGMEDDDYRDLLQRVAGVTSCKELDYLNFDKVMSALERLGFRSDWKERTFGNRPGMATPAQVDLIRNLWTEYSGSDDEQLLNAWLNKYHKVSAVRMISFTKAGKVIPALKNMAARTKAKG